MLSEVSDNIDEAFFDLRGIAEPLDEYGRSIGRTIRRNTGIPVSIGIAPTKTLAKIASKLAKQYPKLAGCCYMHRPQDIEKVLATFPLHDIWGIGRRYGKMFDSMGLKNGIGVRTIIPAMGTCTDGRCRTPDVERVAGHSIECIAFEQNAAPKTADHHIEELPQRNL